MKFKSLYINGRPLKSLSINGRKVWGKQEEDDKPYLKFTAEADGSSVSMAKNGTAPELSLVYSTNGGNTWQDFIVGETTVNLDAGDSMYLKASKDDEIVNSRMATSNTNYNKFVIGGLVKASGNIMTLLRGDGELDYIPSTYCFCRLFSLCTALTQAPRLPATTLGTYCYYYMFNGCTSLVEAPELPSTALANGCYSSMFRGCTTLTQAPELPATALATGCYSSMFSGCTALTQAPELPATILMSNCYSNMFNGCQKLNKIKIDYTGDFDPTCTLNWVNGVASSGDIEYGGEDYTVGTSAIPNGWTLNGQKVPFAGLTFTAEEANSTVQLMKSGSSAPDLSLMTSTDNETWTPYTVGDTITLENVGDKLMMKATTTNNGTALANYAFNKFVMSGKIAASGNIMSILDITSLKLSYYCFCGLFSDCTSLTKAPKLPATTLNSYCYYSMFMGCTSLTKAPKLPATTLMSSCYQNMFYNCTSLTQAPELPATTLASSCYQYMFSGCTSLTQAPELPATTLVAYCYSDMFSGCRSLNEIKIGYTGDFSSTYFGSYWVLNVPTTGTFYYNGSDTTRGTSAIPEGWTIQTF